MPRSVHPERYRMSGLRVVAACAVLVLSCRPAERVESDAMPFPDFGHMLGDAEYGGRVFRLKQDYPPRLPAVEQPVRDILSIDFRADWRAYITAVRDYIFAGNIEHPGYAGDFFLEDNPERAWYHMPWQHWGSHGREGFHGLTKEGPLAAYVLGPEQRTPWQTYAVGFYNELGGHTIGQVWKNPVRPDIGYMRDHGFPVGTVVGKILFTTATVAEVPYLQNPIEWTAFITPTFDADTGRRPETVRLIQMDIMVRDGRARDTGGWVFGTFIYNGAAENENRWHNLVPVGLMWGNDPTVRDTIVNERPVRTIVNPNLRETVINTGPDLPPTHLGWGMRLNGPVDNPASSCMSCHSTAQYPAMSNIMPFFNKPPYDIRPARMRNPRASADTAMWMRWFRNVPCATPFDSAATSMDYSLQLAISVQNYMDWRTRELGGFYASQYVEGRDVDQILRNR